MSVGLPALCRPPPRPPLPQIYDGMTKPAFIFDGRNILDHQKLRDIGFIVYVRRGRGAGGAALPGTRRPVAAGGLSRAGRALLQWTKGSHAGNWLVGAPCSVTPRPAAGPPLMPGSRPPSAHPRAGPGQAP